MSKEPHKHSGPELKSKGLKPLKLGTIDKDYPKRKGGYAFEICESAVEKMAANLSLNLTLDIRSVCRKDSQDITIDDRESLCKTIEESRHHKVLITHGTDTLIQTAEYLGTRGLGKRILLTGAFLPHTFKGSDAEFNVGFALGCLSTLTTPGVYVAMCGRVFHWGEVSRDEHSELFVKKS